MSSYFLMKSKVKRLFKSNRICLILIILVVAFSFYTSTYLKFKGNKVSDSSENYFASNSDEHILSEEILKRSNAISTKYTKYVFNETHWTTGKTDEAGEEVLKSVHCPVTNCFFTHNRTLLKNEKNFDVILFHVAEFMKKSTMPKERSKHQLYAMVTLESPLASKAELKYYKNFFNLTMAYRLDSDVQWDYGKIIDKETNEIVAPSKSPKWREVDEDFYDEEMMEIIKNKTSSIAWFVSHCVTESHRKQLVQKITETIPVDIYGKCGTLKCDRDSPECDDLLDAKYRFYLSFENALCKDYVTEKVFYQLERFVISIVYNGADTSLFAPPKSYIDANKFKDVKELTDYLQYLTENPREYIK